MKVSGLSGEQDNRIRCVWMVTREYDQLAGAGGVKDVCRQLAETLVTHADCVVRVVLPRYGFMNTERLGCRLLPVTQTSGRIGARRYDHIFHVDMDYADEERREPVAVWQTERNGVTLFLVEADRYATKRDVYTYTEEDEGEVVWQQKGRGHYDFFAMNTLLQKAALDLMILLDEHPDIIHCHDGHSATLPAIMREAAGYRHYFRRTGAVVTIHNAGKGYHQEIGDLKFAQAITGLPERVVQGGILDDSFDPFMAAADYAVINTVSQQYALELQQTSEDARTGWLGHALLERGVTLAGITNGIDPGSFDPRFAEQLGIAASYDVFNGDFEGKRVCKADLLTAIAAHGSWEQVRQYGELINDVERPLCTFVGRLTLQKGVDIFIRALHEVLGQDPAVQVLFLGSGMREFEVDIERLATSGSFQRRVCFLKGYDPLLANKVYAAGDFFIIPSRYEPCGLTDYIAQLFGNIPIVHHVGGLVKVVHEETGFSYQHNTPTVLADALLEAVRVYQQRPHVLRSMQMTAVQRIMQLHTWQKVMVAYLELYQRAKKMAAGEF